MWCNYDPNTAFFNPGTASRSSMRDPFATLSVALSGETSRSV